MLRTHPAAWGGLLLNVGFIFFVRHVFANFDISSLPPGNQEAAHLMTQAFPSFLKIILCQLAGLLLLELKFRLGYVFAFIGTIFLLPVSIVYGIGILRTYYTLLYEEFPSVKVSFAEAKATFSGKLVRPLVTTAFIFGLGGFIAFSSGFPPLGGFAIVLSILNIYMAVRAKNIPLLALFDTFLAVTPTLFAKTITLPYKAITTATLLPKKQIAFEAKWNGTLLRLTWSMQTLPLQEQENALQALAHVLRAHDVTLR